MSEFSELIKNFDKIRNYMRDFYVYGFRSREEFSGKSARSYDNERRRIESYLRDYIEWKQDKNGKNIFLTIDGANIFENPLYRAFKAKTFTKNDITLHFIILDILYTQSRLTASEICTEVQEYLSFFAKPLDMELATVRNKLNEYVRLGLLNAETDKNKLYYLIPAQHNIAPLYDYLCFASLSAPLGVVGSFLLDRFDYKNEVFTCKHKYLLDALDSEILLNLIESIKEKRTVSLCCFSGKSRRRIETAVVPIKIVVSVQSGRNYVCVYDLMNRRFTNIRIDNIESVSPLEIAEDFDILLRNANEKLKRSWGVAIENSEKKYTLNMTLKICGNEKYILHRLYKEGRHGSVEQVGEELYKYTVELSDPEEIKPWLRTFVGRIEKLTCDNIEFVRNFYRDLNELKEVYVSGLPAHAIKNKTAAVNTPAAKTATRGEFSESLFTEIFGLYYKAAAKLIEKAQDGNLTERQAEDIINETAFSESFVDMTEKIKSEEWQVLDKSFSTPIKHKPETPLSTIEKQWLKAILNDRKAKLFLENCNELFPEVEQLYTEDLFHYCDIVKEGDDYDNPEYIKNFRTILLAFRENRKLNIEYISGKNILHRGAYIPRKLEYSAKEDKFRLITGNLYQNVIINLGRITKCSLGNPFDRSALAEIKQNKQTVVFELRDERNCLERALIHFSGFQKETEKTGDHNYVVKLHFCKDDETEILIRLLSFGQFVKVLEPSGFVGQIKERINKQKL